MKAEETTLNFQLRSSLRLLLTRLINHPSSRDSLSFLASPSLLSFCTSVSSCDSIISWKENLIYEENPERIQRTERRSKEERAEQREEEATAKLWTNDDKDSGAKPSTLLFGAKIKIASHLQHHVSLMIFISFHDTLCVLPSVWGAFFRLCSQRRGQSSQVYCLPSGFIFWDAWLVFLHIFLSIWTSPPLTSITSSRS